MNKLIVDENKKKPRRTKGTALYKIRNYVALGVLGVGAALGLLYHNWSEAQKIRSRILDGSLFAKSEADELRILKWKITNRQDINEFLSMKKKNMSSQSEDNVGTEKTEEKEAV